MTPYHIFLATTYKYRTPNDILVILDENGTLEEYKELSNKIFKSHIYLKSKNGKLQKLAQIFSRSPRILIERIKKITQKDMEPPELFIFNDSTLNAQYIIHHIKSSKVYYIEDGSAPYNQHYIKHSKSKNLILKFLLGHRASLPNILGTSSAIDASIFTHPDLARRENQRRPIINFETTPEKLRDVVTIFDEHPKIGALKKIQKTEESILILLPFKNTPQKEILEKFNSIIISAKERNITILLKRHPLDPPTAEQHSYQNTIEIPSSIPAEIIPLYIKNIRKIYSTPNTSLLSFAFFHKEIEVNCITTQSTSSKDQLTKNIMKSGANKLLSTTR